jgi:glycosyltransferase involved in cell wall biosynthesis
MWPRVKAAVPAAELDIFSSLKTYGAQEDPYESLYERARSMEGVRYRGSVGQEELRATARECRAMAYPCIFQEMSSAAIMEAVASGCAVVSTDIGVLPETAWRNPLVPLGEGWKVLWAEALIRVLQNDAYYADLAEQNFALSKFFDWELIASRWVRRFQLDFAGHGIRLNSELS